MPSAEESIFTLNQSIDSTLYQYQKIGITSDFLSPKALMSRILESSGICSINHQIDKFIHYLPNTFVPNQPWQALLSEKFDKLLISEDYSLDTTVGIIQIPDDYMYIFQKLDLHKIQSLSEVPKFCNNYYYSIAINEVVKYLSNKYSNHDFIKVHGLAVNPPGLETVTYDFQKGGYIGLHIDSWDKMPIQNRHLASNRICINLGKEDRFFAFTNIPIQSLTFIVKNQIKSKFKNCQYDFANPNNIINIFMQNNQEQSVFKLKIKPGEAYIAPTENIIHDGTTSNKKYIDIGLAIRGYFRIKT